MRKRIVAGNWKMNMNNSDARVLFESLNNSRIASSVDIIVAPPSIYLSEFATIKNENIYLAAQNCSGNENGAYTGEISASMLYSIGVEYCLVGHSERRQYQNESDILIKQKVNVLLENKVTPIFCCGENLDKRESGDFYQVIQTQIENSLFHLTDSEIKGVVIAYEPIWAIGTGVTASSDQAQEIHAFIRTLLVEKYSAETAEEISILYGGSCKASNAKELFMNRDVDGGLIGGAALDVDSFFAIIESF
jgi:triosephosphate isomerase (TIM)